MYRITKHKYSRKTRTRTRKTRTRKTRTRKTRKTRKTRTRTRTNYKKQYGGDYNLEQIQLIKSKFQELGFEDKEINNFLIELNKSSQYFAHDVNTLLEQLNKYTPDDKEEITDWVNKLGEMSNDVETDVNYSQLSQLSSQPSSQTDSQYSIEDGYSTQASENYSQ